MNFNTSYIYLVLVHISIILRIFNAFTRISLN